MSTYPLNITVKLTEPGVQEYCMLEPRPPYRKGQVVVDAMVFHVDLQRNYDAPLTILTEAMWRCLQTELIRTNTPGLVKEWKCLMLNIHSQMVNQVDFPNQRIGDWVRPGDTIQATCYRELNSCAACCLCSIF